MAGLWSKIRRRLLPGAGAPDRRLWQQVAELHRAAEVLDLAHRRSVFRPAPREAPARQRILVIAPHPDDEAIGPGGTLALARQRGCAISVLFVTSEGFAGAAERVAEAQAACAAQGFDARFLPLVPGRIPLDAAAAAALAGAIDDARPEIVFLPFFLDDHDDHRRALELLLAAARHAAAPWAFTVWAYQIYSAAPLPAVVDITTAAAAKRQAIAAYRSEMAKRDWVHYALGQNAAASRFLPGGPAPRFAELFYVGDFAGYAELLTRYFAGGRAYPGGYVGAREAE
ncbi:MAG: PIG-L deacetylase family protein [Kiloniellaceae bacterium]